MRQILCNPQCVSSSNDVKAIAALRSLGFVTIPNSNSVSTNLRKVIKVTPSGKRPYAPALTPHARRGARFAKPSSQRVQICGLALHEYDTNGTKYRYCSDAPCPSQSVAIAFSERGKFQGSSSEGPRTLLSFARRHPDGYRTHEIHYTEPKHLGVFSTALLVCRLQLVSEDDEI